MSNKLSIGSEHDPYDVIVVGAGVVGCAAATTFAKQGRKVLLIERSFNEPDRIVGELLQPGGVATLKELGLGSCLEDIDAIPVKGYEIYYHGDIIPFSYPSYNMEDFERHQDIQLSEGTLASTSVKRRPEGRSFHHGRFISKLRAIAKAEPNVTTLEATAKELVKCNISGQILGIKWSESGRSKMTTGFGHLTVIADGHASNFRSKCIKRKPVGKSRFWGLELKNVELPVCDRAYGIIGHGGPVLVYQISTHVTRILIDLPSGVHDVLNNIATIKAYIEGSVVPTLPQVLHAAVHSALRTGKLRSMPNSWLPPSANKTSGIIFIGDAMNMRHPLTGGGMTVGLNDVLLLRQLLDPFIVSSLQESKVVLTQMKKLNRQRKSLSTTLNVLAQALYTLFVADDPQLQILQRGFVRYIKLRPAIVEEQAALMGGLLHSPYLLFYHFFSVAFYSLWLHITTSCSKSFWGFGPALIECIRVFIRACDVFLPLGYGSLCKIQPPRLATRAAQYHLNQHQHLSQNMGKHSTGKYFHGQDQKENTPNIETSRLVESLVHWQLYAAWGRGTKARSWAAHQTTMQARQRSLHHTSRLQPSKSHLSTTYTVSDRKCQINIHLRTILVPLATYLMAPSNIVDDVVSPILQATERRIGWNPQPNQRGTMDIIWGCTLVLFVCVWAVMHHNIPVKNECFWSETRRKCRWATLAVCAPEMLTLFSVMQWNAANISVKEMRKLGLENWSMVHAFYANAGGFFLHTSDCPSFPINATSIHYLCSNGWIEPPTITRENIWDRSKADLFAKGFAIFQTGWLVVQFIARSIQKLAVSPLELFTVAFILPTVCTALFWAQKPQNVAEPTTISPNWTIAELLVKAGDAAKEPYVDTPMDFVEKPVWEGWRRRRSLLHYGGLKRRPLVRIPNDYSPPPPTGKEATFNWVISVAHAGMHLIGWNFEFPTHTETIIWRACSITLVTVMVAGGAVPVISTRPWFDFSFNLLWIWTKDARKQTWARKYLFEIFVDFAYFLYIAARLLMFAEIFLSFRSLPASSYEEISWSGFLPHVS